MLIRLTTRNLFTSIVECSCTYKPVIDDTYCHVKGTHGR